MVQSMKFTVQNIAVNQQKQASCIVVGVFQDNQLSPSAEHLNQLSNGFILDVLKSGDISGSAGSSLLLHKVPNTSADRILLVGLGKQEEVKDSVYLKALKEASNTLKKLKIDVAVSYLPEIKMVDRCIGWRLKQNVLVTRDVLYVFDQCKGKIDESKRPQLKELVLVSENIEAEVIDVCQRALDRAGAVANGVELMKDLANLPGNICTPTYLELSALELQKQYKDLLAVEVLQEDEIRALGMGSFLSVAQGSEQPPKLITFKYYNNPDKNAQPIVLVGKGITFDTGGISIKPAPDMDEMKYDMSGAASVFGTIRAIVEMKLPLNVVGIIPTCENMPSGKAIKPGDIVKSMSGQTIAIDNTDAEGRLILCDALTYAERFNPAKVVDIATLTGACVIALGHVASGVLGNNAELVQELIKAGNISYDRAWELPLFEEYAEQLDNNFADMSNVGGRPAGTITASAFLAKFTKAYNWAHLDVAGTANLSGKNKGSTGRPVPLLTQFLINQVPDMFSNPSHAEKH